MPFIIVRNDITKMQVDAIVNSTSQEVFVGGGVDKAINEIAGKDLLLERQSFGHLDITQAIITKGYNLLAKNVIHVAAPIYTNGLNNDSILLYKTYMNAMLLAYSKNLESIAFPFLSTGTYRFPKKQALEIAARAIKDFLNKHDMTIYLVVYEKTSYDISLERFNDVKSYIDEVLVRDKIRDKRLFIESYEKASYDSFQYIDKKPKRKRTLADVINDIDDTFVISLFKIIEFKQFKEQDVYKRANIDKKLFSKLRSNINYHPNKNTSISLCIALELNLDETKDLLIKAGYALSYSIKFDIIVRYFIENKIYDIYELDQVLFKFTSKTLSNY
jgi:O-acetyl-ADP-ribose deacetylase (regulator of RNase III)